jgi:branched-chain amino acid transport system permease protein
VQFALLAAAAIIFAAVAAALGDTFYLRLATEALIFAGLALSVDILLGFTGLLSLGQALYFGMGAYISALVMMRVPSFWAALGSAIVAGLVVGLIGGAIVNRVRGVYFALITFGMAQVAGKVVYNTRTLGASDGLIGVPIIDINFGIASVSSDSALGFFFVVLGFIAIAYAASAYVLSTPFGRLLIALRANERRVPFLGYNATTLRLTSYVLASTIATTSGALYPMLRGFVSPELLFFSTSGNAVITAVIGGIGTLVGPLYGSVLLVLLRSVIGTWTEHHLIIIGLIFMAAVIFFPRGLMGVIRPAVVRLMSRRVRA